MNKRNLSEMTVEELRDEAYKNTKLIRKLTKAVVTMSAIVVILSIYSCFSSSYIPNVISYVILAIYSVVLIIQLSKHRYSRKLFEEIDNRLNRKA